MDIGSQVENDIILEHVNDWQKEAGAVVILLSLCMGGGGGVGSWLSSKFSPDLLAP